MLIEDLGTYLQNSGHGTLGSTLFIYQLPDEPDTCLALRGYEGIDPSYSHDSVLPSFERPRLQLTARSATIETAMAMAWAAWRNLSRIKNESINGSFYLAVRPLQSPFIMERDSSNRWIAAANFEVWKEI